MITNLKKLIALALSITMLPFAACSTKDPANSGVQETQPTPTVSPDTRLTAPDESDKTELEKLFDGLGYEYLVIDPDLSKKKIVKLFEEQTAKGREEGYTPVIVPCGIEGRDLLLESVSGQLEDGFDIADELKKPLPDGTSVLDDRKEEFLRLYGLSIDSLIAETGEGVEYFGSDTAETTFAGLQAVTMMQGECRLILLKLPTKNPWEAVIYIPFGGFNECPAPNEMAAILKYWYEKFGAVPAVITFDMLDVWLPEPISADDAKKTAEEQIIFDIDMMETLMMGSMQSFEKALTEAKIWSFWWD